MGIVAIDALYVGNDRGLFASGMTSRALGVSHASVATMIASASGGHVTDLTDVPADTVAAQLEHLTGSSSVDGVYVGALAGHLSAATVFSYVEKAGVPAVFNCNISGSNGETVLTSRGVEVVQQRLSVPDLVVMSRRDAELITEGEINTLDDAQVAVQRIVKRGARAAVIRCGPLPARFFEAEGADRPNDTYNADLYYDGSEFALFEAPQLEGVDEAEGAAAAFCTSILVSLIDGMAIHEAISAAKQYITDVLRATQVLGSGTPLQYFLARPSQA